VTLQELEQIGREFDAALASAESFQDILNKYHEIAAKTTADARYRLEQADFMNEMAESCHEHV
jgi:hypothetical protein